MQGTARSLPRRPKLREASVKRVPVIGTLRVLLVEDSENDAMLLLQELRRGGYKPLPQRVYTPEDMEKALRAADARDERFQVVISDYYMPRFSAPHALRLLRELGYDVPFIVVSGKIDEDAAVEIMKAGANDYLTKENMSRLCPAIERELREAEVRRERERAEKALDRSEDLFRRLVEQIPAVTYVQEPIDSATPKAITYMSPQYEAMLGYPAETEILDEEHWLRVLHPDDRERVLAEELRTDETGEPYRIEYRLVARGGRVVWVRDEATLVRDEDGNSLYWLGVQYDITEHKRTEEQLRQSEALYRTVVEQAEENIFLVDAKSRRVLEANDALLRSLGYTDDELQEMTLYDIVAHDQKSIDLNIGRIMEEGHRSLGERQYRRKDGSLADVEVNVSAVPYNGEKVMCVVAHDVTERKRAERMLEEIREAERNRLARELHDSTLQDIVYALQEIQVMQVVSGDDPALEDAADALKRSVEGLRGAIFELRLKETLDRSLISSLENLVDLNRRMARGRYELELVVEDDFPSRLPGKTGQELTRLVQEALTNVRRHAEAGHVRVELGLDGVLAYVEVSDDGRGFDAEMAGPGMGRQSMRHRALELGGRFDLESAPGEGTRVRFSIPVSRLVKG